MASALPRCVLGDPRWAASVGQRVAVLGLGRRPCVAAHDGGTRMHVLACQVNAYGEVEVVDKLTYELDDRNSLGAGLGLGAA
jgi:hypothetical protein